MITTKQIRHCFLHITELIRYIFSLHSEIGFYIDMIPHLMPCFPHSSPNDIYIFLQDLSSNLSDLNRFMKIFRDYLLTERYISNRDPSLFQSEIELLNKEKESIKSKIPGLQSIPSYQNQQQVNELAMIISSYSIHH